MLCVGIECFVLCFGVAVIVLCLSVVSSCCDVVVCFVLGFIAVCSCCLLLLRFRRVFYGCVFVLRVRVSCVVF